MDTDKKIILAGGVFGFLGVALGAFGAHGLKNILNPELLEVFRTGVFYQLIHSVVILAIGISGRKEFNLTAVFLSVGIILFSFSLYAYTMSGVKAIAMITPVGGILFLAGWFLIIIKAIRNKTND